MAAEVGWGRGREAWLRSPGGVGPGVGAESTGRCSRRGARGAGVVRATPRRSGRRGARELLETKQAESRIQSAERRGHTLHVRRDRRTAHTGTLRPRDGRQADTIAGARTRGSVPRRTKWRGKRRARRIRPAGKLFDSPLSLTGFRSTTRSGRHGDPHSLSRGKRPLWPRPTLGRPVETPRLATVGSRRILRRWPSRAVCSTPRDVPRMRAPAAGKSTATPPGRATRRARSDRRAQRRRRSR